MIYINYIVIWLVGKLVPTLRYTGIYHGKDVIKSSSTSTYRVGEEGESYESTVHI